MIINNSHQVTQTQINPLHNLDSQVRELTNTQKKVILVALAAFSFLAFMQASILLFQIAAGTVCLITTLTFLLARGTFNMIGGFFRAIASILPAFDHSHSRYYHHAWHRPPPMIVVEPPRSFFRAPSFFRPQRDVVHRHPVGTHQFSPPPPPMQQRTTLRRGPELGQDHRHRVGVR